jgi:Leucine-rich repeat (LRR) protein
MSFSPQTVGVLLLATSVVACGGRSASHRTRPNEPRDCEGPITFPDPALDRAVRMRGNFAEGQPISPEEALSVQDLYVEGAKSLDGLECLTKIRSLTAREGPITDIGPLAELRELSWLDLSGNAISDLSPLAGHTELEWIDLTRNAVEDLGPLASNLAISDLRFDFNRVTSLEPLSNTRVAILLGTNNAISDLGPLAGMTTFVREISLSYNPIRDLSPLSELTQLEVLRLDATEVEDLSTLVKKPLLYRLHVDRTRVRDLRPLSNLPALQVIHARSNQIDSLEGVTLPEPRCDNAFELVDNPLDMTDVAALCATGWVIRYGETLAPQQCNLDCLK